MRRITAATALLTLVLTMLFASSAAAASPHFKGGEPNCTVSGTQVTCSGQLAGLGKGDVTVLLTVQASTEIVCTNPAGNVAPGQTQTTTATGTQTITPTKNGSLAYSVTSAPIERPAGSDTDLGCPNNKWDATLGTVTLTGYTLTFSQGGRVVLSDSGSFS
jgi:hypothetical protein